MAVGAFAIISDEQGRFLLSHRRDMDMWNLPGGTVEPMEAPWEAVVREVLEETGLRVRVQRLVGVYTKTRIDTLVFSFLCSIGSGELSTSDEADEHRYFALEEMPRNFAPSQLDRLRDFVRAPDLVTLKTQSFPSTREYLAGLRQEGRPSPGREERSGS